MKTAGIAVDKGYDAANKDDGTQTAYASLYAGIDHLGLVHGKISEKRFLAETNLSTQQELDAANTEELD